MNARLSETCTDPWFPLSAAQRSRWFIYKLDPEKQGRHNNVFAVRMHGAVDERAIRVALSRLAQRHAMLRARFSLIADEPHQRVAEVPEVPLSVFHCEGLDESTLRARVIEDVLRPFDLLRGPVVRASVYKRSPTESVFALALDHIVSDGWSYWRLLEEFGRLLVTASDGQHPETATYQDYITWQCEWLRSPAAQKQLSYWEAALDGELPVLVLPFAREHSSRTDGPSSFVTLHLSAALAGELKALAARQASTLFTCLLAGYQILLHRYSGQAEVIVGCPVPGRTTGHWDAVVGDFVNVIPLRARFDESAGLSDVLRQARNTALRGMANQDYPFARLVEQLHLARAAGEHPVFQTLFAFQKARQDGGLSRLWSVAETGEARVSWQDIELTPFYTHQSVAVGGIGLTLQVLEVEDGLRCDFEFDAGRIDAAAIERFAKSFRTLLEGMVIDDHQHVCELALLGEAERQRLLVDFNSTHVEYERDRLVHQWFEQQAELTPGAVAVESGGQKLTYAEVNRRANQLAHYLISAGVKPDDRVAICTERSVEMVVGLLGILKSGGAYVPLDPAYPQGRQAYMLNDCTPVEVLTPSRLRELELSEQPTHNPDARVLGLNPSHLAYVIYTSGSTGQPKGVMIEHRHLANLIQWHWRDFDLSATSRCSSVAAVGFDAATWEIWPVLSIGATLVLAPSQADPEALLAWWASQRLDVSFLPTPIAELALSGGNAINPWLRTLLIGGDRLRSRQPSQSFALINNYGPTETTVVATSGRLDDEDEVLHIGRPIANTQIYILDSHLQPVPIGVAGEIHVGGAQVARGYLNRPELTAQRFIDNPFGPGGSRLYKTGDLARWRANGTIEYLGRNDFQVKVRGFRIELGEIESQLSRCSGVREALVLARDGTAGDKRLVAYVVGEEGSALSIERLRSELGEHLAEYMVPSAFVVLERLPLTANGKLDRAALPAPDESAVLRRAYEEPVGEVEQTLARIWQELLGVERVGRQDHFFEIGGHSLLAMQVVTRLTQALGVHVSLRELFSRPVLSSLAAGLSPASREESARIPLADRSAPLPLSLSQQRLWFLDQLDHAASLAYHIPAALRLKGELDREALRAALARVVERHESLRTRMVEVEGMTHQVVDPPTAGFPWIEHDLAALLPERREQAVEQCRVAESARPFDLSAGPLIRGRLLRLSEHEHILLVTQHHIVSDGWSLGVLMRELRALYSAFRQGRADPLPPLELQYADYAVWQRQCMQGAALEEQIRFWREQLQGAPELLELPADRARPGVPSYSGGSVAIELSRELTQGLRELSRRHGITLFMTLLSGWSVLLSRLSGQTEVVIGTPVANRDRPQLEGLIGFFVNTLALRVRLTEDPSVGQLLSQVKSTALQAYAHQQVPFEQVVEALNPSRSLSHSPIFQTMLALNNTPDSGELSLPGLELSVLEGGAGTSRFDLSLLLSESGERLVGSVEYAADLFEETTIRRWVGYLQRVLRGFVLDDRRCVSELPLLSEAERQQLLVHFNATQVEYEQERLVHQWFEEQVERNAHAVAVDFAGEKLTYAELNRRANQVAHHLIASGVKPDDRVAICTERGLEMVVGLLGILKSGGAYVPLDPGYPQARLDYMLGDCAPIEVLTQSKLRELQWGPDHNPDARARGLKPSHLAYVIYTSGSTGQPKGVMIEHRQLANLIQWHWQNFGLSATSRCSSVAAVGFDAATWEIWPVLSIGATLTLAPPRADPQALLEWWSSQALDVSFLPTPIAELAFSGGVGINPGLCTLLIGGDRLRFRKPSQPFALINNYGPTETTVVATSGRVGDEDEVLHIGRPIANTQIYILDKDLQPAPIGVAGEIHIGGAQVARGYLNRADLTAQRFIDNPFGEGRLYKTGDLARWRANGTIEYLGRNDFQVKVRGFRIELGEIESQLSRCSGVREALVVARDGTSGDKRLVAYVVGQEGQALSIERLRAELAEHLAEYMVPSAFVVLDNLPLTANGKLDRASLPAPDESAVLRPAYEEPVGEVEPRLARIWQELLGVERVGRQDHFFEIGGHSLALTRLSFQIKEQLGTELRIAQLYQMRSLEEMASCIEQQRNRAHDMTTVTLEI